MTDQEKRQQDLLEGQALSELFNHSGWKSVVGIFQEEYNDAVKRLFEKDDAEARATIKILQAIMDRITYKIDLSESIKKDFANQTQTTP